MKIAYLESEDLFTSNGFFKIWNFFLGKIFPIFGQYFVPTLAMTDLTGGIAMITELSWVSLGFAVYRKYFL